MARLKLDKLVNFAFIFRGSLEKKKLHGKLCKLPLCRFERFSCASSFYR